MQSEAHCKVLCACVIARGFVCVCVCLAARQVKESCVRLRLRGGAGSGRV